MLREAEANAVETDTQKIDTYYDGVVPQLLRTRNPVLYILLPGVSRVTETTIEARAWYRLALAAAKVEQARTAAKAFPEDAEALDLPKDPHAQRNRLRYARVGEGYQIWSVGSNHRDDGGKAEFKVDLVLERPPVATSVR